MNATVPVAALVPATVPTSSKVQSNDLILVQLAREIAMDIQPLELILKSHDVSDARWAEIQVNHRFLKYLEVALTEWHSSLNTAERVRIKSLSMVEEVLPEMYARMNDPKELLPAKVRLLEVVGKIGGVGVGNLGDKGGSGDKFSVTINLGSDQKLIVSVPVPQVVDAQER